MTGTSDVAAHYTSGDLLVPAWRHGCGRTGTIRHARPPRLWPPTTISTAAAWKRPRTWRTCSGSPRRTAFSMSAAALGGPARYMAERFGCRVDGIDLTAEFCAIARHLTALLGLTARVSFEQGDALAMPFGDAVFDGAYSMNVSMNIADKRALYREIHRVLKPGGWLSLSEVVQGSGGAPDYPTPWARTAATSFLASPAETRENLEASGFVIETLRETTETALAYAARSRATGRSRRTTTAPRRLAHPRRACREGDGELGAGAEGASRRAHRDRLPQGAAIAISDVGRSSLGQLITGALNGSRRKPSHQMPGKIRYFTRARYSAHFSGPYFSAQYASSSTWRMVNSVTMQTK